MKGFAIRIALILTLFVSVERLCHRYTHGFRLWKIQPHPEMFQLCRQTRPHNVSDKKLRNILSQPYRFLRSGSESYAFASEDGHYVLKFFKNNHMRKKRWGDALFPKGLQRKIQQGRIERCNRLVASCELADAQFASGAGLIYLHLRATDHLHCKVRIFDPIGCIHRIDLDTHTFALQKRAQRLYPCLSSLIEMGEVKAAESRIAAFFKLVCSRCDAGLADCDAPNRNCGFIGQQAIAFDLGSFFRDESLKLPHNRDRTLIGKTRKLRRWLAKRYPQYLPYFDKTLETYLSKTAPLSYHALHESKKSRAPALAALFPP